MTSRDDYWADLEKQSAPELDVLAEADAALGPDPNSPVSMAMLFNAALSDIDEYENAARNLVHPDTVDDWGDFREATNAIAAIPDAGIGHTPNFAVGSKTVCYVKILSHVTETFVVSTEQLISVPGVFTMVWWPSQGRWVVYGFGPQIPPEQIRPLP